MNLKNKKFHIAILLAIMATSGSVYARPYPKMEEVYSSLPSNCDPNVMRKLFANAEQAYQSKAGAVNAILVKEQVQATPTAPADNLNRCLSGAMSAVKGIANGVDGLLGIFSGATNPGAAAAKIAQQIGNAACNKVDGYLTGGVYNSTSGVMGKVNQATGVANGGVNVNTGLGNINVGGGLITPTQSGNGPVGGAINGIGGAVNNNINQILK